MARISSLLLTLISLCFLQQALLSETLTVREALQKTELIAYPQHGRMVDVTVANAIRDNINPSVKPGALESLKDAGDTPVLSVSIADEAFDDTPGNIRKDVDWMVFRLGESGNGSLIASKPHLLYALYCHLNDEWLDEDVSHFTKGRSIYPNFTWLRGDDGFFADKKRFSRGYCPEKSIQELARLGCSNVVINSLSTPFSLETGPPGEIYYRFYIGAPDLDQFTETALNQGSYPPEYLDANMQFLKAQAKLAEKYGISPGLYICNPRSVPEALLEKYPFLRGARVDHPFRSFRPRYNLTLGHPAVRWHYARMLSNIMNEIPEISFITTFLNDSGSGFEYTARLYSGRNGGAYIAREWITHDEFATAAADNVVRYYRLLRDTGREINPEFHIIAGLFAIPEEQPLIMDKMDAGIDLQMSLADMKDPLKWSREQKLRQRGSHLYTRTSADGAIVLGVPAPWFVNENLNRILDADLDRISVSLDPPSLAPYDINRDVVKWVQFNGTASPDDMIRKRADEWVGDKNAADLVELWKKTDNAVRLFPEVPLYSNHWAFEMYRFWVRPYVPDIGKIAESDRAYYEKYAMATFNNPHRVDFGKDVLWDIITREQGENIIEQYDNACRPALNEAMELAVRVVDRVDNGSRAEVVFTDFRDRLLALECLYRSLRNIGAWVAGVHGYMDAENGEERAAAYRIVEEMMDDELENARNLLALWEKTDVEFIPIHAYGETWHEYGDNLGELIQRKINLMEKHRYDKPYIDPDFMWRMPADLKHIESKYMNTNQQ